MVLYTNEANVANTWKLYLAISLGYNRAVCFFLENEQITSYSLFEPYRFNIAIYFCPRRLRGMFFRLI